MWRKKLGRGERRLEANLEAISGGDKDFATMNKGWLFTFILGVAISASAWGAEPFCQELALNGSLEPSGQIVDNCSSEAVNSHSLLAADSASKNKKAQAYKAKTKAAAKNKDKKAAAKKSATKAPAAKKLKPRLTEQERKVKLHGTRNTRQLGGLPTSDGKFIKEGVLYRSGALCYINDSDIEILKDKGIVSVIELRTTKEIASEGRDKPAFAGSVKKIYNLPMVCTSGTGQEAYASYIKKQNYSTISQFFKVLANNDSYPVLFHCSAGKDRTGIMAALVLELLRVPRPIIMDDYLASQRNSKGLKVNADWLRVVFKNVDKAGGIEPFLHSCGVSTADMKKVRENLLVNK